MERTENFGRRRWAAGSALVELALAAPVLMLMLAGVLNYGFALRTAAVAANAARIGAQYGSSSPTTAADTTGIRKAALNSAPHVSGLSVSSSTACQCSGGGSVSCSGSCSGSKMMLYVQVTVSGTAQNFFSYAGLGFRGAVSAQAKMRAQ